MAMYAVPSETLTGIADAIRSKTGSDDFMTVSAMASAIESISGGGDPNMTHYQYVLEKDTLNAKISIPEIIGGASFIIFYSNIPARTPSEGTRCSKGGAYLNGAVAIYYGNSTNTSYTLSSGASFISPDFTTGIVTFNYTLLSGTYDIVVAK